MVAGHEEAERLRSECEHVLRFGAEQEQRIALLHEEIATMQKERIESATDDAKDQSTLPLHHLPLSTSPTSSLEPTSTREEC
jgi:hypothetical protein